MQWKILVCFGNVAKESPVCRGDTEECVLYTITVYYFKRLSKYQKKIIRKMRVMGKRLEQRSDPGVKS